MISTPGFMRAKNILFSSTAPSNYKIEAEAASNASNNAIHGMFLTPKAGKISAIGYGVASKNGSGGSYDFCLETVTGREPSGTLRESSGHVTLAGMVAGAYWASVYSACSVAAGEYISAVIRGITGTTPSNNNQFFSSVGTSFGFLLPFAATRLGTAWTLRSTWPCLALQYDDGTIIEGGAPIAALDISTDINTETNPDELGIAWTAEQNCYCPGAHVYIYCATDTSTFDVLLYGGTAAAPVTLASVSYNPASMRANAVFAQLSVMFSSSILLSKDQTYRLVVKPSSAQSIRLNLLETIDVAMRNSLFGNLWRTQRLNAGTFTDFTTKVVSVVPLIDNISIPTGGGVRRASLLGIPE